MARLNITDRRERLLVRTVDGILAMTRRARPRPPAPPERILLFRLERIGDLLMALPAIATLRAALPQAAIDLVVGSWNADLATSIPGIGRVETLDLAWLGRESGGLSSFAAARIARAWRSRRYDLAINFEPDIRSNRIAAGTGAAWTAGFSSGGGGPLLDLAIDFDTRVHTSDNLVRLVAAVVPGAEALSPAPTILNLPERARQDAAAYLGNARPSPRIGMHVNAGRLVKQWPEERFREVAGTLIRDRGASIVLTGAAGDRDCLDRVSRGLPESAIVKAANLPLVTLAAIIAQLDLFVSVDTGPMHLAQAVGTPTIAIFGPSDPVRYGPRGRYDRSVRIDLPCSPCNRIRTPPARCTGHVPDCLTGLASTRVLEAIDDALRDRGVPERSAR